MPQQTHIVEPPKLLLVTKRQASELISVSVSTIDNLIRTGVLATRLVRKRRLILYSDLCKLAE